MTPAPDLITDLGPGEVFVFGSNEAGRHGKGAARQALAWGAVYGQGFGLQGRTFAIPTKDASVTRTLPLPRIAAYVARFAAFAREHPELTFLVTEVGCGLAGLKVGQVAPLFLSAAALANVRLPRRFLHKLGLSPA